MTGPALCRSLKTRNLPERSGSLLLLPLSLNHTHTHGHSDSVCVCVRAYNHQLSAPCPRITRSTKCYFTATPTDILLGVATPADILLSAARVCVLSPSSSAASATDAIPLFTAYLSFLICPSLSYRRKCTSEDDREGDEALWRSQRLSTSSDMMGALPLLQHRC